MENPSDGRKRRKRDSAQLAQFLGAGGVSMGGLLRISQKLREDSSAGETLSSCVSNRPLIEANNRSFLEVRRFEQLELEKGGHFAWEFCEPGHLLAIMVAASPRLQDIYAELANARSIDVDNPLSLIVAFDEFTPGNKRA